MKNKKRFLALLFCFVFLVFAGCDGGPEGILDDENPKTLAGVKVLSKPADYFDDIDNIVGDSASANYYNIFAANILRSLYNVYEEPSMTAWEDEYFLQLSPDEKNSFTYTDPNFFSDDRHNYLLDSIRYTISQVENVYKNGVLDSQTLTLNLNSWNWTLPYNLKNGEIMFYVLNAEGLVDVIYKASDNKVEVKIALNDLGISDWTETVGGQNGVFQPKSFSQFYVGSSHTKTASDVVDFWTSPYYKKYEGQSEESQNYFQDALEYATYMFVNGFDYEQTDANGATTVTEYAPLFKFEIEKDSTNGVTGMKVAGWNANETVDISNTNPNTPIEDALSYAKTMYLATGTIVGVTDEIKEKVARFIIKEVIGDQAFFSDDTAKDGTFTVKITDNDPSTQDKVLYFNRNYQQIVRNIIDYACDQAPIGFDSTKEDDDKKVYLGHSYMASQVADYPYDYFSLSYDDEDDSDCFHYIEAQEYQSMILFPQSEDIGKTLGTLILAFEYNDNPNPERYTQMLDELTLTVGLRYYDSSLKKYTADVHCDKTISRGKFGTAVDSEGEDATDQSLLIIDNSEDQSAVDLAMPANQVMRTEFVNGDPLSAPLIHTASGMVLGRPKKITGTDPIRQYYKPDGSLGIGTFGSLYGDVGDATDNQRYLCWGTQKNCDYIEVYFYIHKTAGNPFINYNFKVGVFSFLASESALGDED